ncbi:MFS transporter, partial [Ralstonia solanacearum]|nr:MFS transporter [Ralstonia solanacearum]MBB6595951.1 MFS transporter [Ralstonia solanacearum]
MHGTLSPSLIDQTRLRRPRHAVATAILGNAFEWFDFTLYGFFAPVI